MTPARIFARARSAIAAATCVVASVVVLALASASPAHADFRLCNNTGSRVGIATQIGDPLGQMKISGRAKSQGVDRDATALLTACGLALRSFD